MAYSQAWLEANTARRMVFIEVTPLFNGSALPLYFSSASYNTTSADIVIYSILNGGVNFTESISIDGSLSITNGDIEIANAGHFDFLIRYVSGTQYTWSNAPISIYYGDVDFVCSNLAQIKTDFKLIFSGVVVDIDSRDRGRINIRLADKLQKLNQPITETKLGTYGTWSGGQTNVDSIMPLAFGEVFNISPMLIDPSLLEYVVSSGANEQLIEVRDNGVPVSTSSNTTSTDGKFKLTAPATGTVTCSYQGLKQSVTFTSPSVSSASSTYNNNIASIIATIVTQYGANASNRLTLADIDTANFYTMYTTYTQPIGMYISDRANTLETCNTIAASIGGQVYCNREGLLQILILGTPTADASVDITTSDMISNTFKISSRIKPIAATKLGYAKNWTVQEGLITAIPDSHKDSYATEWLTYTSTNSTVASLHKLTQDPIQQDTLLLKLSDATTEANRRNAFFDDVLHVYSFTGTSKLLSLKLGQAVRIFHPRFALNAGVTGQVITLSQNWLKGTVDIEVII